MMHTARGHTLVELLIAMGLAALISVGVASLYVSQNAIARSETQRDRAQLDAHYAYDIITHLLRQAATSSVVISYPGSAKFNADNEPQAPADDALVVDFLLPAGYPVWPNDQAVGADNFPNNAVRLHWQNTGDFAHQIQIGTAATRDALADAALRPLTGGDQLTQTRIINFDVWPLSNVSGQRQANASDLAIGGYVVRVTARTAGADASFQRTADNTTLAHYRTYTLSGGVAPRN
ncbi:MAG: prepilin-type N-terminal cleavage/methylation domain-containing protein [Pseudomonadota bacterium]